MRNWTVIGGRKDMVERNPCDFRVFGGLPGNGTLSWKWLNEAEANHLAATLANDNPGHAFAAVQIDKIVVSEKHSYLTQERMSFLPQ